MKSSDTIQRFVFEAAPVRGELVHLDATWRATLERHEYPMPVQTLLGECMVSAALLAATIKFQGSLIIQLQGSGPVSMLVVECTSDRTLRGLAHWSGDIGEGTLGELAGDGRLAITIDPGNGGSRYQSIVPIEGERISDALESYLRRSEQLDTRLWIATGRSGAAGMLLQKLPEPGGDADMWNRASHLAETVEDRELLELPTVELLHRLYHEERVRVFEAEPVSFRCRCSREKVRTMLRALGPDEVHDILAQEGKIGVHCEFCNQYYEFDAVDAELLLAADNPPEVPDTRH